MGKLHIKKIQHKYFEDILKNRKKFENSNRSKQRII